MIAATFLGWFAPTLLTVAVILFPGWVTGRRRK